MNGVLNEFSLSALMASQNVHAQSRRTARKYFVSSVTCGHPSPRAYCRTAAICLSRVASYCWRQCWQHLFHVQSGSRVHHRFVGSIPSLRLCARNSFENSLHMGGSLTTEK